MEPITDTGNRIEDSTMTVPVPEVEVDGGGDATAGRAAVAVSDKDTALGAIYAAEYDRLVDLARLLLDRRADAEEVVQEAFVRVYASWRNVRTPDDALPYVRGAVVNLARGGLRRRIIERRHGERMASGRPDRDHGPGPDTIVVDRLRDAHLVEAVRALPRRQREVVVLRYLLGTSTRETADTLGCSEGAVKAYLHRALQSLRETLHESMRETLEER